MFYFIRRNKFISDREKLWKFCFVNIMKNEFNRAFRLNTVTTSHGWLLLLYLAINQLIKVTLQHENVFVSVFGRTFRQAPKR